MNQTPSNSEGKIVLGDCLEVMRGMADNSVDLVLTSPPYNNLREYGGYSFDFEPIAKELYRLTKDGGVVVWVIGDQTINGSESGTSFRQALYFKKVGFNLHDTMIYAKNNPVPQNHGRYEQQFEYMFVLSKGKPKTFNVLRVKLKHPTAKTGNYYQSYADSGTSKARSSKKSVDKPLNNIWYYTVGHNYLGHPAVFPPQLAHDHILSWSNEGDLILDPFNGSGTTTKIAKKLNRNYIGIEINPDYVKIAQDRLKQEMLL